MGTRRSLCASGTEYLAEGPQDLLQFQGGSQNKASLREPRSNPVVTHCAVVASPPRPRLWVWTDHTLGHGNGRSSTDHGRMQECWLDAYA